MRSGLFIDGLRAATGLGRTRIERRIRENQYEAHGSVPPADDTVGQWFKLQRPVPFEPRAPDDGTLPWLMAAEREFPGSSFLFFHPLIDLVMGTAESTVKWELQSGLIPEQWIEEKERAGRADVAAEWKRRNESRRRRPHRKIERVRVDDLEFVRLSLLRLPDPIRSRLFCRRGTRRGEFERRYQPAEADCQFLGEIPNVHALAAVTGLTMEAALIGDAARHRILRRFLATHLETAAEFPECRRVFDELRLNVRMRVLSIDCPSYSEAVGHALGRPTYWRMHLDPVRGLKPVRLRDSSG